MNTKFLLVPLEAVVVFANTAFAKVYLTAEQAQAIIFPGAKFTSLHITLTATEIKAIEKASGVGFISNQLHVWKVSTGGLFIVDEVIGKHQFIPFALGLNKHGEIVGVEILEYREAYGDQIRNPKWLQQFIGKKPGVKLRDGKNIQNISGATLSSAHLTDGITRLLSTYEIVLKAYNH